MLSIYLTILFLFTKESFSQDEDDGGPYRGKYIGKLNSYHHQVSGDVYAVDEWSFLLVNLNYDGAGDDTFFWAGDAARPGPQGFIVPDQNGKTNILERYYNDEIRLTLPEGKRIATIKWLAIYDIASQNAFGDVYIPEEFEPPAVRSLPPLVGDTSVSSGPVRIEDAKTIVIPEFRYDGSGGEVYFWTGVGALPSAKGIKIPDEYGYLEPLRAYRGEDVRLELPGERTVFELQWLAVYDVAARRSLGEVAIPEDVSVPPTLTRAARAAGAPLPHCAQLHRRLQLSWEVFGDQVTLRLAGQVDEDEYMAVGVSGERARSAMLGADVAVTRLDRATQRAHAVDYNVTALTPCVRVLGAWRGVCRDDALGGVDNNQAFAAQRADGVTAVTFRRSLKPQEPMDLEWPTDRPAYLVWAIGKVEEDGEPAFHTEYPTTDVVLHFGDKDFVSTCEPFVSGGGAVRGAEPWERAELSEPSLRTFTATLGPAGGRRGYRARAPAPPPPLVWYVNGHMAPALQMRRGLAYEFVVRGGDDPHSAAEYHPLVVAAGARGGLGALADAARREARVLAGVAESRRGRALPTAAGALCAARRAPGADARRDDDYASFRAFNRSLRWRCAAGAPARLALAPDSSWPDVVYYHSFTHRGMGGPIYIVDRHQRGLSRRADAASSGAASAASGSAAGLALATLVSILILL